MPCLLKPLEITFKFESMAADKKQNRKSPSEETIKALGNSIDECWNELNNLPQKEFPPVQTGEIISSTWNNASGKENETIQPVGEVIQEQPCDDLDSILGKSINQSMKEAKNKPVPTILWGDDGNGNGLWYENELAVLFGRTNTGKSIYAVQIAEHITENLNKGVLYIDLEMSMKQFQQRYTSKDGRLHVWSELLKRPEMEKVEWALDNPEKCLELLRKMLDTLSVKILRLDNLTFLVNNGGMKPEDVKLICSKLCEWAKEGDSILVINHTPKIPPFTPLDLNHCLGSSMLTNFVQSVFAIGTSSKNPSSERYVKQLKSRNGTFVWDDSNVLPYTIDKTVDPTMLQFIQTGKSKQNVSSPNPVQTARESDLLQNANNLLLEEIRRYHEQGLSNRQIADKLNISPTTVGNKLRQIQATSNEEGDNQDA